jgi:hypothetical protein
MESAEPMESAARTMTLDRRVSWANEHWGFFFSEMPLRETGLGSFRDQSQSSPEQPKDGAKLLHVRLGGHTNNKLGAVYSQEPRFPRVVPSEFAVIF